MASAMPRRHAVGVAVEVYQDVDGLVVNGPRGLHGIDRRDVEGSAHG